MTSTTNSASPAITQPPSSTPAPQLTDERASEIGWFFIKSYYDFFVSKLDEIHKIYHAQASINHDSFPGSESETTDQVPVAYKAKGTEAIKETFSKYLSGSKNNRIVITSACFQVSVNQNIIIVVFGEWSANDQPFKQFTQTFVLVPGKVENFYDVANDILRFVVVNGYKEKQDQKQEKEIKSESSTTSTTAVEKSASSSTTTEVEAEKPKEEVKPQAVEPVKKEELSNGSKEEPSKTTQEPVKKEETIPAKEQPAKEEPKEIKQEVKVEPKKDTKEEEEQPKEEEQEQPSVEKTVTSPPQQMTWAALAQQAVPAKPPTKPAASLSSSSSPVAKTTVPVKKPVSSASSTSAAAAAAAAQSNGKIKREDWYPIYIRGIRTLNEKDLKDHLSKKFGDLKFFKVIQNIALVDFVNQEAQRRALDARETTLDGITFALEPRESKTGNNYHNSSGSGNYKKFGGQVKDGAKNKDKFDNKKVNGGKKNVNKPATK